MTIDSLHGPVAVRCHRRAAGFSLVELLVVIAIIGVILSILLPAFQAARESVRRTECINKHKQLALASMAYETTHGHYPVGAHNSRWTTWVVPLAAFMEDKGITEQYKRPQDAYTPEVAFNSDANKAVTQRFVPWLCCPSDGLSPIRTTLVNEPSAHNYVACTGNGAYVATVATGWLSTEPAGPPRGQMPAPGFGNGQNRWQGGGFVMSGATMGMSPPEERRLHGRPRAIRTVEVTDGLANTLAFSEVIRRTPQADGRSADLRGLSWWGPGALFSTLRPPNGSHPDVLPGPNDCGPEHPRVFPPCHAPHTSGLQIVVVARSRHPGGVVASTLGGQSRFFSDTIDARAWEELGSAWGQRPGRVPD